MQKIFLVGIAGGSGSGKTTFAKKVMKGINSAQSLLLHMDSYYLNELPRDVHTNAGKPNFDHPNAFDWELLRQHLHDLKAGKSIQCPIYDFTTSGRTGEFETLGPCKVVLFEGIFTLYDQEIRDILDIKCFLHVDSDIRFTRRLSSGSPAMEMSDHWEGTMCTSRLLPIGKYQRLLITLIP